MTQLEHFDLHDSDFESSSSPPFPALKETISASIIVSNLIRIPIPNGKICRIRRSTLINLLKSAKDPAAIFGLQGNGEKEKMEMKKRLKAMSPVLFLVNVNPRSQSLNLQNKSSKSLVQVMNVHWQRTMSVYPTAETKDETEEIETEKTSKVSHGDKILLRKDLQFPYFTFHVFTQLVSEESSPDDNNDDVDEYGIESVFSEESDYLGAIKPTPLSIPDEIDEKIAEISLKPELPSPSAVTRFRPDDHPDITHLPTVRQRKTVQGLYSMIKRPVLEMKYPKKLSTEITAMIKEFWKNLDSDVKAEWRVFLEVWNEGTETRSSHELNAFSLTDKNKKRGCKTSEIGDDYETDVGDDEPRKNPNIREKLYLEAESEPEKQLYSDFNYALPAPPLPAPLIPACPKTQSKDIAPVRAVSAVAAPRRRGIQFEGSSSDNEQ